MAPVWLRSGMEWLEWQRYSEVAYLSNPYTGEAVYEISEDGSLQPGARRRAYWYPLSPEARAAHGSNNEIIEESILHQVQDLREQFPSAQRCRWYAASLIQRNVRGCLSRWRLARMLVAMYQRQIDYDSWCYVFVHPTTGDTSYHKPYGMGIADLWDPPLSYIEGSNGAGESALVPSLEVAPGDSQSLASSWDSGSGSIQERHKVSGAGLQEMYAKDTFQSGPYCRRAGPGPRRVVSLFDPFLMPQQYRPQKPFRHPADPPYARRRMGEVVYACDGRKEKEVVVDAYFMIRAAWERGPVAVVRVMEKFDSSMAVQGVGLQSIAKAELPETPEGMASEGAVLFVHRALLLLREWPNSEWIQVEACNALASLSEAMPHRRVIMSDEKCIQSVVASLLNLKSQMKSVVELNDQGHEVRYEIEAPTLRATFLGMYACRVLSNLASEDRYRKAVAELGATAVIRCLDFITADPVVTHCACIALYNFVYRNEAAHDAVTAAGALAAVRDSLRNLPPDEENVQKIVIRTLMALEPQGWRGSVDAELPEDGQPDLASSSHH